MPTRQIPLDVAARSAGAQATVPLLADAPFAASGVLEPGIHLHWALPDELVKAQAHKDAPPRFRGVPDLWLVVRFNPVQGDEARTHRAWVVDSVDESVTALDDWVPPTRPQDRIHTGAGVLERVGQGWGQWSLDEPFDQLVPAYYPSCRRRLGFHDDIADLDGQTGDVSYAVVGWYSSKVFDPFPRLHDRTHAKFGPRPELSSVVELATSVAQTAVVTDWSPAFTVQELPDPPAGEALTLAANVAVGEGMMASAVGAASSILESLGGDSAAAAVVDAIVPGSQSVSTVLHGSIIDVPLRRLAVGKPELETEGVVLYPNVQRAMAEVAARSGDEVEADHVDMMLGNLGQQSGSTAGVIDLPGAQHARLFQGVPGRSRWYARLEIRPKVSSILPPFALLDLAEPGDMVATGNWSPILARSAAIHAHVSSELSLGSLGGPQSEPPAGPSGPSDDEIVQWITQLRQAFSAAQTAAATAGTPLDPHLVRVQDHRADAAPVMLGASARGAGTAQAGWWLDLGDPSTPIDIAGDKHHLVLAELYRSAAGAIIELPGPAGIFEVPGPRWYRPWSPHLVMYGAKRSYRFGADGRFRLDGHLQTRLSGDGLVGLKVGGHTILGTDLVAASDAFTTAGLPAVARGLIAEHALTDPANAPIMARTAHRTGGRKRAPDAKQLTAATRSLWLQQRGLVDDEQAEAIAAIEPLGTAPSAVALQAWSDWYGPLFLDTEYTHRRKRFGDAWQLPPEFIETVDRNPVVPPDREQVISERVVATVTVAKVLKENLVTELTIDPQGNVVHKQPAPDGVDESSFDKLDIVSASLTHLDESLLAAGEREQGGFVHVGRVRVFDVFGTSGDWTGDAATLEPLPASAVAVPARLTSWGRLHFRLQSAADPLTEATPFAPPVCGFLLPDFVDQALEVYDADGRAVGQLSATDPMDGNEGGATTLTVAFTLLPWVADTLPEGAEPTDAITDLTLRRLVEALLAQSHAGGGGRHGLAGDGLHRDAARVRHGPLHARAGVQGLEGAGAPARRARHRDEHETAVRGIRGIRRRPARRARHDRRRPPHPAGAGG